MLSSYTPQSNNIVSIRPQDSLEKAAETLLGSEKHHLIVVDDDHKITGLLSDREIISGLLNNATALVSDVFRRDLPFIDASAKLSEVWDFMQKHQSSAAIVKVEKKPVGIITTTDLLDALCSKEANEIGFTELMRLKLADPTLQSIMKTLSDIGI